MSSQPPLPLAPWSNLNLIPSNHLLTFYFKSPFISKAFLVAIQIFSSGNPWATAPLVSLMGGFTLESSWMVMSCPTSGVTVHIDQGSAIYSPGAKSHPLPAFVNILLERSPITRWCIIYDSSSLTVTGLHSSDRDHTALQSGAYLLSDPF